MASAFGWGDFLVLVLMLYFSVCFGACSCRSTALNFLSGTELHRVFDYVCLTFATFLEREIGPFGTEKGLKSTLLLKVMLDHRLDVVLDWAARAVQSPFELCGVNYSKVLFPMLFLGVSLTLVLCAMNVPVKLTEF
jgi:hypothetical protein